jgi:DNA topoisomerase IA
MQSPTKYIETNNITENEDIAEEWGLGTASTRAGIIERLTSVGYIKKNNRALFPTRKGIRFIKLIQDVSYEIPNKSDVTTNFDTITPNIGADRKRRYYRQMGARVI